MTDQDQPPTLATEDDLNELYMAIERKMFMPLVEHYQQLDDTVKQLMAIVSALHERERMRLN